MNELSERVELTDKDLLKFRGKEVRIGQFSLVHDAIEYLLSERRTLSVLGDAATKELRAAKNKAVSA